MAQEPQPPTLAEVVRRAVDELDGHPPPNVAGWLAAEGVPA